MGLAGDGDPVLGAAERNTFLPRVPWATLYIFGSIGTLNRLDDAGHYQHRLGGGPIHINNIIAIRCLRLHL